MQNKLVPALVTLVVVAAFVVGLLYGQVSVYRRFNNPNGQAAGAGNGQQAQPEEQPEEATQLTEAEWKKVLDTQAPVKGKQGANVVIAEFTDYQCPFCSRYYNDSYKQLVKEYVDTGKVEYRTYDMPLSFHPNAKPAALAAHCAGDQNKYWEMHDLLFEKQSAWSEGDATAKFEEYAKTIGLNVNTFKTCVANKTYDKKIDDNMSLASSVGASGTPTFFINGQKIVGAQPYSAFKAVIDQALGQ